MFAHPTYDMGTKWGFGELIASIEAGFVFQLADSELEYPHVSESQNLARPLAFEAVEAVIV